MSYMMSLSVNYIIFQSTRIVVTLASGRGKYKYKVKSKDQRKLVNSFGQEKSQHLPVLKQRLRENIAENAF